MNNLPPVIAHLSLPKNISGVALRHAKTLKQTTVVPSLFLFKNQTQLMLNQG